MGRFSTGHWKSNGMQASCCRYLGGVPEWLGSCGQIVRTRDSTALANRRWERIHCGNVDARTLPKHRHDQDSDWSSVGARSLYGENRIQDVSRARSLMSPGCACRRVAPILPGFQSVISGRQGLQPWIRIFIEAVASVHHGICRQEAGWNCSRTSKVMTACWSLEPPSRQAFKTPVS